MGFTRLRTISRPAIVLALLAALSSCALLRPAAPADEPPADEPPPERPVEPTPAPPLEPAPEIPPEPAPEEPAVPQRRFEVIASGQQSAVRVPIARAVTSPDLWTDVWAAVHANRHPQPERPPVDFGSETVVVLLLGERRTGGYEVRIAGVRSHNGVVEVDVEVEAPAADDMVTQALTAPYLIATIPYRDADVIFTGDDLERGFEGD